MRDYTKIKAWQFADDLTVSIYDATKTFPREELYGLTSQLRRAASSTAANIVEGSALGIFELRWQNTVDQPSQPNLRVSPRPDAMRRTRSHRNQNATNKTKGMIFPSEVP
jgi:hypothetical protein